MEPIDHIDLVVSDLERSVAFYRALLAPLGYTETSEITGERGERVVYVSRPAGHGQIGLRQRQRQSPGGAVDRYAVGLHHLAFTAPDRATVDAIARRLQEDGHPLENAPQEWPYAPGYYAAFLPDPDGIKLEVVHQPEA